ncbi:hypothetical protein BGZ65_012560, partial [Modicella reniformis]
TWYLAESPDNPALVSVKTIISESPLTIQNCKEVMERIVWTYYMPPWNLDELENCRSCVEKFKIIDKDLMKKLYDKIGGVPRYALEKLADALHFYWRLLEDDPEEAKKKAYQHIQRVIHQVWNTVTLGQFFDNKRFPTITAIYSTAGQLRTTRDSDFKSHPDSNLQEIGEGAWADILQNIVFDPRSSGRMFGSHVAHIFRKGGYTFEIKELGASTSGYLQIPPKPLVELFEDAEELSRVIRAENTLCIPNNPKFLCLDLALGPNKLFQATMNADHPLGQSHLDIIQKILAQSGQSELHLYFVVPTKHYADFKLQGDLPGALGKVRQFALKFDTEAASIGM